MDPNHFMGPANQSMAGGPETTQFQPIPSYYTVNLWVIIAVNICALGFALGAIFVRLKDPERRFLIKKTERAEGVYLVPHSPFLASLFISQFSLQQIVTSVLAHMFWKHHKYIQACQTMSSILSIPLWSWVWISLFAPVYACHLFPPDAVEEATSRRMADWLRLKPKTVNLLCYGGPITVALPIVGLSAARAAVAIKSIHHQRNDTLFAAGVIFQTLYSVWTVIFFITAFLFVVYSVVLIRILKMQLSTLKKLDKAAKMARAKEIELADQQARELPSQGLVSFETPTNGAVRQLTTDWTPSELEQSDLQNGKAPRRPCYLKRSSWLKKARGNSGTSETSLQRELGKYSKLELLQLNTRLIVYEAIVFSIFCLAWAGFALARASIGPDVIRKTRFLARLFLIQGYISSLFALASAFFIFWRGLNVANTRLEHAPTVKPSNNMFREFAQKFHPPVKPVVEAENAGQTQIHVQVELMQHESKCDESDKETAASGSPREAAFDEAADGQSTALHHAVSANSWQAPDDWNNPKVPTKQSSVASFRKSLGSGSIGSVAGLRGQV